MRGGWGMAGGRPDGRIGMDRAEVIDNQASIPQGARELSQTNCIGGGRSLHGFDSQRCPCFIGLCSLWSHALVSLSQP